VPAVGPGGGKNSLKFQTGDDIIRVAVSEGIINTGIERFTSSGQNNGSDIKLRFFGLLVKGDGAGRTKLLTGFAFSPDKINALLFIYSIF
jgi:hypothetical protein